MAVGFNIAIAIIVIDIVKVGWQNK